MYIGCGTETMRLPDETSCYFMRYMYIRSGETRMEPAQYGVQYAAAGSSRTGLSQRDAGREIAKVGGTASRPFSGIG